jgi:hypothetical protein
MRKKSEPDLAAECRARFLHYCLMYHEAKFHKDKRHYVEKAYEQIDIFLDLRDVQSL